MKKIILILAVLVAAFALASCVSHGRGHPAADNGFTDLTTVDPVPAEPAAAPPAPSIDLSEVAREAYLATLGEEYPVFSEAELLDFANVACAALESYPDPLSAAQGVADMRAQLDDFTASSVVGGVIGSGYCEHTWSH